MADGFDFTLILRTPWGGPWRRFSNPVRMVTAMEPGEVRPALAAVDREVARGAYAAGFVAYEASAAFGLPCLPQAGSLPLVCFGIFEPLQIDTVEKLPRGGPVRLSPWHPSIERKAYLAAIRAVKTRIEAGDTYQINFTFRLTAECEGDPRTLMRDLFAAQAGDWSAYVDLGTHVICSASPELFYKLAGGRIECRPMKGTSARGLWPAQDSERAEALRTSEKNRAENVMIVDMVRNDVGRFARTGTVRAAPMFQVEPYPLQWQMISTVEAQTEARSLLRLFEAMFPTGSVTGAPKQSAMGIIRDLETTPRGIYTGAIGYVSPNGRSHFNVAIRTVVVDRSTSTAEFGVGSGVVWDSVDRDEYDECLVKAQMLTPANHARVSVPSYVVADPPGFRLLETLAWFPDGGFFLLERHIQRLLASARAFGFAVDEAEVRNTLDAAVEDLRGPARIRLQVEAGGTILCDAVDLLATPPPLRVALANEPIDRRDVFLYHKTTNRSVYERARAQHPEADTVLLWNADHEITEAAEFNVIVRFEHESVTPPIECGVLPGTYRAHLLETGDIVERRVTRDQLRHARRIQLINSVRGTLDAVLIDPE